MDGDLLQVEVCGKNGAYYKVSAANDITKMFRNIRWMIPVKINGFGGVFVLELQCIYFGLVAQK